MTEDLTRLRGARKLLEDAVEHGSAAVEKVHLATAARPFGILEQIPVIAEPTKVVHVVHDLGVKSVYFCIRKVNRVVGAALDLALDVAEQSGPKAVQDAAIEPKPNAPDAEEPNAPAPNEEANDR